MTLTHLASGGALACVLGRSKEQSGGRATTTSSATKALRGGGQPGCGHARIIGYGVTHSGTVVAHAWQRGLACCC